MGKPSKTLRGRKPPDLSPDERAILVDIMLMLDSVIALAHKHFVGGAHCGQYHRAAEIQDAFDGHLPWHPGGGASEARTGNRIVDSMIGRGLLRADSGQKRARKIGLTVDGAILAARMLGYPPLSESLRHMRRIALNPRLKATELALAGPAAARARCTAAGRRKVIRVIYGMLTPMALTWVRMLVCTDGRRVFVLTPDGEAILEKPPAGFAMKPDPAMLKLEMEAGPAWDTTLMAVAPEDSCQVLFGFGPGCRKELLDYHIAHARGIA
jgi:hypothetical protein